MKIVTRRAKDVGLQGSVRITPRAWANCVGWTRTDTRRTGLQVTPEARLLWLLFKVAKAVDSMKDGMACVVFMLKRQPRRPEQGAEAAVAVRVRGTGRRRLIIIDIEGRSAS